MRKISFTKLNGNYHKGKNELQLLQKDNKDAKDHKRQLQNYIFANIHAKVFCLEEATALSPTRERGGYSINLYRIYPV